MFEIISEGSGAVAEYLVTSVNNISLKTKDISREVASVIAGVCAYLDLDEIKSGKDSRILVIGRACIQIAKHKGGVKLKKRTKTVTTFADVFSLP
ncbi:hypothetical protein [Dyadobacter psychrotolerans]|uniref:Uncharacterized protein n=1 Tax=Dyadobacter psychrotolerans TaxID=2541721 RepID=A0A4R5DDQ8_9BACT|nr:hypothetical protein [Dyadobacter psychrotolerans]TDE08705.1 hypothetical protein E0F88_32260 [Dyadobacter psychrotolerans]